MQQMVWSAHAGEAFQLDHEIRDILYKSGWLANDATALSDEDDLYAAGLTSHGSVNLMLALEERFEVEFPEHLLRRRTFESIAAIRAAVISLRHGAPDA